MNIKNLLTIICAVLMVSMTAYFATASDQAVYDSPNDWWVWRQGYTPCSGPSYCDYSNIFDDNISSYATSYYSSYGIYNIHYNVSDYVGQILSMEYSVLIGSTAYNITVPQACINSINISGQLEAKVNYRFSNGDILFDCGENTTSYGFPGGVIQDFTGISYLASTSVPASGINMVYDEYLTVEYTTPCDIYSGSGTEGDPYQITDIEGLQGISACDVTASYELVNNIDASDTINWYAEDMNSNPGTGFSPIYEFSGNFDGQGYVISDLYINISGGEYIGLFGSVLSGNITNVGLSGARVYDAYDTVGSLIGFMSYGVVNNSYSENGIVSSPSYIGGLIGNLYDSTIENSYANNVSVYGTDNVGGLIGVDEFSLINNCSFVGYVYGDGSDIGGLSGYSSSAIDNVYIDAEIEVVSGYDHSCLVGYANGVFSVSNSDIKCQMYSASSSGYVGGVIGKINDFDSADISNIGLDLYIEVGAIGIGGIVGYAVQDSLTVSGVSGTVDLYNPDPDGTNVGGIIGEDEGGSNISDINIVVNISAPLGTNYGGIIGYNVGNAQSEINNATVSGYINTYGYTGGFVGYAGEVKITDASFDGYISGDTVLAGGVGMIEAGQMDNVIVNAEIYCTENECGGIIATNNGIDMNNVEFYGSITSSGDYVGGIVGYLNTGSVNGAVVSGNIEGASDVGGIAGDAYGSGAISNAVVDANITSSSVSGGIVGYANIMDIEKVSVSGNVISDDIAGGIAGFWDGGGTITDSYSEASVTETTEGAGGLVGYVSLGGVDIYTSYASGPVSGTEEGGLIGFDEYDDATVTDSYWDTEATGQATTVGGGTGLTTEEAKLQLSFDGFDFDTVWGIDDTYEYPQLGPKTLKLLSYTCVNVTPIENSVSLADLSVETNDGSKSIQLGDISGSCVGDNCSAYFQYYSAPGDYDLLVTMTNGSETLHRQIPSCVNYGELVSIHRSGDTMSFVGNPYGGINVSVDQPIRIYNYGNVPVIETLVTAYDLTGVLVPSINLSASYFRAGSSLQNSAQLQNGVGVSVPFNLTTGNNSYVEFYLWMSAPSNQYPQAYTAQTPWSVQLS
jgi:hypothetical protein